MNYLKTIFVITIAILAFTVPVQNANAVTVFGIDFKEMWNNFWNNNEEIIEETKSIETKQETISTQTKPIAQIQNKRNFERNVTIANKVYTENYFKAVFKEEQTKKYVQGFGYKCLAIETDKGTEFTLYFRDNGTLEKMRTYLDCDDTIFLEESLIEDIENDGGFKPTKIKTYLEKTELPTSMYLKAIKVFTVG